MTNQIGYYSIVRSGGEQYWAASSKNAILKHIGDPRDSGSVAQMFGHRPETLRQITEQEAQRAPYFKAFAKGHQLCADETWCLGMQDERAPE